MTDIVVTDVSKAKKNPRRKSAVNVKRMRNSQGQTVRILSLDAHSTTFADDLTTVFEKNVARARRENKRLFGTSSGFRAKKK